MRSKELKHRLLILSDLWGKEKSEWLQNYTEILEDHFEIKYYDCCELAEIDTSEFDEVSVHQEFINGGIEKAVKNLKKLEHEKVYVLGFSIGGLIAWKSTLQGLICENFFAVSSTRLRQEIEKPSGSIHLFYGESDPYQPGEKWFSDLDLENEIFKNEGHDFYQKKNAGQLISQKIIQHCENIV